MTHDTNLFPSFDARAHALPKWFIAFGLKGNERLVSALLRSRKHWEQAEADGLGHLTPIIMVYNAPPKEIRKTVGGHIWQRIRTASRRANANRMVLMLYGGWTLDEAMEWPEKETRRALRFLGEASKDSLLIACRHTQPGHRLINNFYLARDFQRMGGKIDPNWGRKRLKKEHDALAVKKALSGSDPKPWAKRWYCDIEGYTFTLLNSETELAMEGAMQRHCCRSYASLCRAGHEIVFSIMGRERATMSWNRNIKSLQVKAFANGPVSPATKRAARLCIERYLREQEVLT